MMMMMETTLSLHSTETRRHEPVSSRLEAAPLTADLTVEEASWC
jgi:hypothetical protein